MAKRIEWNTENIEKMKQIVEGAETTKAGCDLAAKEFGCKPGSIMSRYYAAKKKKRASRKAAIAAQQMFLVTVTSGNKTSKRVVRAEDVRVELVEAIL